MLEVFWTGADQLNEDLHDVNNLSERIEILSKMLKLLDKYIHNLYSGLEKYEKGKTHIETLLKDEKSFEEKIDLKKKLRG